MKDERRPRRQDTPTPDSTAEPERIAAQDGYVGAEDEETIAERTEEEDAAQG